MIISDSCPVHFSLLAVLARIKADHHGSPPSTAIMRRKATDILRQARAQGCVNALVSQMVRMTGIESFLPERYAKFQPAVAEGMVFFMASLPLSRLAGKIVDQIRLPASATLGERLVTLIRDLPTIQKLGQIICRSPGLNADFKQALLELEDNIQSVNFGHMRPSLKREIARLAPSISVVPERQILAQASVCAVLPTTVQVEDHPATPAVLKLVKPAVRRNLARELSLLERLAGFLDQRKTKWKLGQFNFRGTMHRVRQLLENEIDLNQEQNNLDAASSYFEDEEKVLIPERLPASTAGMTAMSRLDGIKITKVDHLTQNQRRLLAEAVARLCILKPVQEIRAEALFHADPHAGNLAYSFEGRRPRIIFYDWGMVGRLDRLERFAMLLLTMGLVLENAIVVFYAADILTQGQISRSRDTSNAIKTVIGKAIERKTGRIKGVLSCVEYLFERFTYEGVVFSADLIMFEKNLLTLKGVLHDIDPSFDRDQYLAWAAFGCLVGDVAKFRIQKMILDEIWSLYSGSLARLWDVQKVLMRFMFDASNFWTHRLLQAVPIPVLASK